MLNAESLPQQVMPSAANQFAGVRRLVEFSIDNVDRNLPAWARRSDPIVRRHLGAYWKTFALDLSLIGRMYAVQVGIILASFLFPAVFTLMMPIVTVSLVFIPVAMAMYAAMLYRVGASASASLAHERRDHTLPLLRTTPRSMVRIVASKGAAAMWRHTEDLVLPLTVVAVCSLPVLVIQFDTLLGAENPGVMQIAVILALGTTILRLFFETGMIASIGLLMGASTPSRSTAALTTLILGAGYFIALNLARLLPFGIGWTLFIEIAVPLITPPLILFFCLRVTVWLLERE